MRPSRPRQFAALRWFGLWPPWLPCSFWHSWDSAITQQLTKQNTLKAQQSLKASQSAQRLLCHTCGSPHEAAQFQHISSIFFSRNQQASLEQMPSPGRYMPCICGGEDNDAICCRVFIEDLHLGPIASIASIAKVQLQWQWYQNLWSYCWNHVACQQSEQLVDLCLDWCTFGVMVGSPFDKILVKLSQLSQVHFVSAGPVNAADSDWVGTLKSRWSQMITDGQFMPILTVSTWGMVTRSCLWMCSQEQSLRWSSFRAKMPYAAIILTFHSCSATCWDSMSVRSNISQPGLADFQHKCRDSHHLSSSHKGRGAHSDTAGHAGSWGALNIFNHLYSFCFCTCPTCTPSFIGFTVCQPPKPECTWTSSFIVLDWVDFELGITWFWMILDGFGVYGKRRRIRRTNSTTMMALREKCCLWSWQVDTKSTLEQAGCQIHPDTIAHEAVATVSPRNNFAMPGLPLGSFRGLLSFLQMQCRHYDSEMYVACNNV